VTNSAPQRDGLLQRIVGWLRAGYPDGVPQRDYIALLGILQRVLTPTEVDRVVKDLSDDAESGKAIITREHVQDRIEDVVKGPAVAEDVGRVSAKLAAAGWPLGTPDTNGSEQLSTPTEGRSGVVTRVVDWLREGYPTGLPSRDYITLIALLRRRLTDTEVAQVSHQLATTGTLPADRVDVAEAIAKVTSELPSDEDIARVRAYLADHGWPLDFRI
jgi:uncharacterized protein (DUF2267 family)